jgi:hypothetical protein
MRNATKLSLAAVLMLGVLGCDGGSGDMAAGPPKGVDMTKSYTPAAKVDLITPKDQAKGEAARKAALKNATAPAAGATATEK